MQAVLIYSAVYQLSVLTAGLFFTYLGYKLLASSHGGSQSVPPTPGGDSEFGLKFKKLRLFLRSGAPGLFLALFGAVVICVVLVAGRPEVGWKSSVLAAASSPDTEHGATDPVRMETTQSFWIKSNEVDKLQILINDYRNGHFNDNPEAALDALGEIVRILETQ